MTVENALNIYTDGSSFSHPRKGGVGVLYIFYDTMGNEIKKELIVPGYPSGTNNQMELQAVILGLKNARELGYIGPSREIYVYTDSQYVSHNYTNAMFNWSKNGWFGKYNQPIENAGLWKELVKEIRKSNSLVIIKWVKGHSKDIHNKEVDKLAKKSAKNPQNKPLFNISVRRKLTKEMSQKGSVSMDGQRITIRIITCQKLNLQNLWRYKYEVMSKNSKFYKKADNIISEIFLKDGHTYYVKLNNDKNNPRMIKLYKEIIK